MVCKMKVKCYAVLDAKIADFHLAIFDIKNEGAMRQFSDAVNDKQTKWNKHPEDYSLWYVGEFDTAKGELSGVVPENLVNAVAVMSLAGPGVANSAQLDFFDRNGSEKIKEPVN